MKSEEAPEIERLASLEAWRHLNIFHDRQREARDAVLTLVNESYNDDNLIALIGPSGVGKSNLGRTLADDINEAEVKAMKVDSGYTPVIYFQIAHTPEKASAWKALLKGCLYQFNDPTVELKRLIDPKLGFTAMSQAAVKETTEAYRQAVINQLRQRRTKLWILDEGQHLLFAGNGRTEEQNLETIKSICDSTATKCLLIGPYILGQQIRKSEQLSRRTHEIHFSAYGKDEDNPFLEAISNLERYLPLPLADDVLDEDLVVGSLRCVGLAKNWLARACRLAQNKRAKVVRRAHLEETRFSAKRLQIFIEKMRLADALFSDTATEELDVRSFLGLTTKPQVESAIQEKRAGHSSPGTPAPRRYSPTT